MGGGWECSNFVPNKHTITHIRTLLIKRKPVLLLLQISTSSEYLSLSPRLEKSIHPLHFFSFDWSPFTHWRMSTSLLAGSYSHNLTWSLGYFEERRVCIGSQRPKLRADTRRLEIIQSLPARPTRGQLPYKGRLCLLNPFSLVGSWPNTRLLLQISSSAHGP